MPQGFKYSKQWEKEDNGFGHNRGYNSHIRIDNNSSSKEEQTASFFILPRLKIDKKIGRQDVPVSVIKDFLTPTEVFQGIVWNFRIKNRRYFTTVVEGCIGEVLIPNLEQRLRLTWQRPPDHVLPTECTCSAGLLSQSYRYEYQRRLGWEYIHFQSSY
ncbi:MAG: hypothetical protein WA667_19275 [Candidatus Nitrosopolaris sp.]